MFIKGHMAWNRGQRLSESHKKKIGDANRGKHPTKRTRKILSQLKLGTHLSEETKRKIGLAHIGLKGVCNRGKKNPMFGRKHSKETLMKMRNAALNRFVPGYNPIACQEIDEYGKHHGYNFQHAMNGGEIHVAGYSVDGYDKKNNVVVEYYEKKHKYTTKRDERRKQEIINQLNCRFIELKEWEMK